MSAAERLALLRSPLPGGVWSWERHGPGWALYVDRGEPIDPDLPRGIGNIQHGYNILGGADFDVNGESLRTFILGAANLSSEVLTERDTERKAWAQIVNAVVAEQDAMRMLAAKSTEESAVAHGEAIDRYAAAKQALRDLGVDVDSLLEER